MSKFSFIGSDVDAGAGEDDNAPAPTPTPTTAPASASAPTPTPAASAPAAEFPHQAVATAKQAKTPKKGTPASKRQRRGKHDLSRKDWNTVYGLYEYTGSVRELAKRSGLHADVVSRLLDDGIPRLGLPGIKEFATDQTQVELRLAKKREQSQALAAQQDKAVTEAATERAITDAAAAQDLLSQAITSGVIISCYVEQLAKKLATGEAKLAIPDDVGPSILESLAKVSDANSRAMERAIKMYRLTKGKPTEQVEHRIAALLASCSTDELRQAAMGGGLPRRLVARTTGVDSIDEGASAGIGINSKSNVIDVEFVGGEEPNWLKDIAPAEGHSYEDPDASTDETP